ncbi:hypothetical protein HK096_006575, partial [Nowakowskiella sp. JEL0078]
MPSPHVDIPEAFYGIPSKDNGRLTGPYYPAGIKADSEDPVPPSQHKVALKNPSGVKKLSSGTRKRSLLWAVFVKQDDAFLFKAKRNNVNVFSFEVT